MKQMEWIVNRRDLNTKVKVKEIQKIEKNRYL